MRPERVILENHLHVAFAHGYVVDGRSAYENCAFVGSLEPCDESECGRFTAAALAYYNQEFAFMDIQMGVVNRDHRTECFRQVA